MGRMPVNPLGPEPPFALKDPRLDPRVEGTEHPLQNLIQPVGQHVTEWNRRGGKNEYLGCWC